MKDYYSFVYLDNEMIEDLYPQIFDDVIGIEISNTKEETKNNTISGNLMSVVSASKEGTENISKSENIKLVTSVTKKAQLLINHFKTEIVDFQDIIRQNQPFEDGIICVGRATFELKDIYNKKTGKSILYGKKLDAEDERMIKIQGQRNNLHPFYIEPDNDSVFRLEAGDIFYHYLNPRAPYGIMLNISNYKMKKEIHHLTEMIRLGREFTFYIFGELIMTDAKYYKISPFAIWQ